MNFDKQKLKWIIVIASLVIIVAIIIAIKRKLKVKTLNEKLENAFNSKLSDKQKQSIEAILRQWRKHGDNDPNKLAYILATIKHESRFLPVREGFTSSPAALIAYLDKQGYWYATGVDRGYGGRGFVQLTLKSNYKEAGEKIGVDLISNPERALETDIAAEIAVRGMLEGWFSSNKPLSTWIDTASGKIDFVRARQNVNVLDRAELIAGYAEAIQKQDLSQLA